MNENWINTIADQCCDYWTKEAKECYDKGCDCSKCRLLQFCETLTRYNCSMKYVVRELVRKFGVPNIEDDDEHNLV